MPLEVRLCKDQSSMFAPLDAEKMIKLMTLKDTLFLTLVFAHLIGDHINLNFDA